MLLVDCYAQRDSCQAINYLLLTTNQNEYERHGRCWFLYPLSKYCSLKTVHQISQHYWKSDGDVCIMVHGPFLENGYLQQKALHYIEDFAQKRDENQPIQGWLWDWAFKYDRREYLLDWYKDDANRAELTPEQVARIHGWQLIELAKRGNFKQMLSFCTEHKNAIDINATDDKGTALMHAAKRGNYACVKLLKRIDADIDIHAYSPESKQSAFDVVSYYEGACRYQDRSREHKKIYKLLVSAASKRWHKQQKGISS